MISLADTLTIGLKIIDKYIPDPEAKARLTVELETLAKEERTAELQAKVSLLMGQLEINKIEAQHPSLFIAGWRPAVGWICVCGLGMEYLIYPLARILDPQITSGLDLANLFNLLLTLLGMSALRTYEKYQEIATPAVAPPTPKKESVPWYQKLLPQIRK